jgi:predicted regulator of amino acid metabolism with ACT domain|tara:strand:- start:712 stop:1164 length:453 start_codon:yes stop_codon:yes gene_type:complete
MKKMVDIGISINADGQLMIDDLKINDTALANCVGVDRRVVRNTVNQILEDKKLKKIFRNLKPAGASLVEIAKYLEYSVLIILADSYKSGIISEVSSIFAENNIVIRQALAEDSHLREEPQLILIIQGKINSEIISKIKALKSVKGIVLKK